MDVMTTTRRRLLKGAMNGCAATLALPFLECFLNGNGTALASGAPLPVRFGTWFWGLGHNPNRALIEKEGTDYAFGEECAPLIPYKDQINFFSHFNTPTDGRPNLVHVTGWIAGRTGTSPSSNGDIAAPTLDVLVADAIGGTTRFRSLELSATGNPRDTYSARGKDSINPAEVSPVDFYNRVFGVEFSDPNKSDFKPNPSIVLRKSVLSVVKDQRDSFTKGLGAADKIRLDEYFSSIRQLEQQLNLQLQKPPPAIACTVPPAIAATETGTEIDVVRENHRLMSKLLAMTLACNQTNVFNLTYSGSVSLLRKRGESATHHNVTHEELIDPKLGYQVKTAWFCLQSMEAFAEFIKDVADIKEGDSSLLDNTLIFAHTDTSYAKIHAVDNMPMMTVGKAGGRVKAGMHIKGNGDPLTRIGLTVMQVMGVPVSEWGTRSLQTKKPISEIVV